MANKTQRLGLNVWLENDLVNFDEINENFELIDGLISVVESGTKTATFTGGSTGGSTIWNYKRYSDNTVEMWTKLEFTNLKCNGVIGGGSGSITTLTPPFYSGTSKVYFPFTFASVNDVQMHLASNTIGWVSDTTPKSVSDYVQLRVMGMEYETTYIYKQVFVCIKGVIK